MKNILKTIKRFESPQDLIGSKRKTYYPSETEWISYFSKLKTEKLPEINYLITIVSNFTEKSEMNNELFELISKIERTRKKILSLKDNFDEAGSKAYKKKTLNRIMNSLINCFLSLSEKDKINIKPLEILPGPDQSIDLLWKTKDFQLLINIPNNPKELVSYYGDDYGDNTMEGTSEFNKLGEVIKYWVKKYKTGKQK